MIPISFINPLSDEGKQIVREDGGDLDRIFDENEELKNIVSSINSQEKVVNPVMPKNYVDLVIKRVEWHIERKNNSKEIIGKYSFLFHSEITKYDVISFYILCQAIAVKFGSNSRESRAIVELQGELVEERLKKLQKKDKLEILEKISNDFIVQDKIKWTSLVDLLSSKKIDIQDLVLKDGYVILDREDFLEYFEDVLKFQQPERMYNLFIGNEIKETIITKMIMQNTEDYIKSVYEKSKIFESNPTLLKIAENVSEVLSKEIRHYGSSFSGGNIEASPFSIELFPPCIQKALDGIKSGGRNEVIVLFLTPFLSYARLHPSVFRDNTTLKVSDIDHNLQITKNEILPMIYDAADRCSPPLFDDQPQEKVNINSKLGFGMHSDLSPQHEGETMWYTPMSCDKVKLNMPSVCNPNKTCKKINETNPLFYYINKMEQNK